MPIPKNIYEAAAEAKGASDNLTYKLTVDVVDAYQNAYAKVETGIQSLLESVQAAQAAGKPITTGTIRRLEQYAATRKQLESAMSQFGETAASIIDLKAFEAAGQSIGASIDLTRTISSEMRRFRP